MHHYDRFLIIGYSPNIGVGRGERIEHTPQAT